MKKLNISIISVFIILLLLSCGGPKLKTVEDFGNTVFKAFQTNDMKLYEKCLLTEGDLEYLIKKMKISDDSAKQLRENYKNEYLIEVKKNFVEQRQKAENEKVDFNSLKVVNIEYEIRKNMGSEDCDVKIYLESKDNNYLLEINDGVKVKKNWKIGEQIRWQGKL